jgi:hypothetical protein
MTASEADLDALIVGPSQLAAALRRALNLYDKFLNQPGEAV